NQRAARREPRASGADGRLLRRYQRLRPRECDAVLTGQFCREFLEGAWQRRAGKQRVATAAGRSGAVVEDGGAVARFFADVVRRRTEDDHVHRGADVVDRLQHVLPSPVAELRTLGGEDDDDRALGFALRVALADFDDAVEQIAAAAALLED